MDQQVMPRHMQPREVAELKGAVRKDPQRYRNTPPAAPLDLGTAPEHLNDAAKACWFEIATYAPVGVLRGADRVTLELLAGLLADYRKDPDGYSANRIGLMLSCLARLGMTPADRQKLGTEKPKDDEFQEFE